MFTKTFRTVGDLVSSYFWDPLSKQRSLGGRAEHRPMVPEHQERALETIRPMRIATVGQMWYRCCILSYLSGKFRRYYQGIDQPTTLSQASLTHEARLTNDDRERVAMPVWKRGSNRRRSYTHGPTVAKLARPSKWSFVRLSAASAAVAAAPFLACTALLLSCALR